LLWQPIKVAKSAFFTETFSSSHCHSETDWHIETPVGSLEQHWMWLHRVQIWWWLVW